MNANNRGFSLVELLIALTIVSIVSLAGMEIWTSFVDDTHKSNSDQLAKSLAIQQKKRMSEIGGYGRRFTDPTAAAWLAMTPEDQARFTREEGFVPSAYGDHFGFKCENPASGNSYCKTNRWAVFVLASGGTADHLSNQIKQALRDACDAGNIDPPPSDCSLFSNGAETKILDAETVAVPLTERGWKSSKGWVFYDKGGRRSVWAPPTGSEFGADAWTLASGLAVGQRLTDGSWTCLNNC